MTWDEEHYGREYDLDVFNIVAVSDFNMGAMENKGLNVFNDKYVLANPDVATDSDYANIEAIIAHEYFHNWTGNRITCRDWFQLCLKEGLTVYRDQEFSADQRSRAVQRIHQVRVLKAGQFKEDAGPLAHPVRPNAYKEINNFYTATIYQKGAELVRMLATLVEPENYRKATDLYFERHDGEAAIMEDFIRCFEEISGRDLSQFMFWYEQAGTPEVSVTESWNEESSTYSLELVQTVPPTPGGFPDSDGNEVPAHSESPSVSGDVILLEKKRTRVKFTKLSQKPIVSLLRGFSAPVNLNFNEPKPNRLIRAKFDPDLYNRWDALNGYLVAEMARMSAGGEANTDTDALLETLSDTVFETATEPAFRALVLSLPSVGEVARHIASNVNPDTIHNARMGLMRNIAQTLGAEGVELISALGQTIKTSSPLEAVGQRSLKNALLSLAVAGKQSSALELAIKQFETAENMTDRIFAFSTLLHYQDDTKIAEDASQSFYDRFADNALVVNSWFSIHAATPGKHGLAKINELLEHEQFTLTNPNRARSLLGPFASANLTAFHQTDGSGYKLFLGEIKKLDDMNPQIAARLLTLMGDWRMYSDERAAAAKHHLTELANSKGLSKDVQEIVDRSLG